MITWQLLTFEQLTTHQLYQVLKLRVDVFVVEQDCPILNSMEKTVFTVFIIYWVIKMMS